MVYPGPDLGQVQKCDRVQLFNGIPALPSDNRISNNANIISY